jgi:hypothetical protein
MRSSTRNGRRTGLRVESLEGKVLLSTGPAPRHLAPRVMAAPIVAQAAAGFSGTLTGSYSNVNIPGFSHVLGYTATGTLTGVGSTRLHGTLLARGGLRPGRLDGQLVLRHSGGRMIINVVEPAVPGGYSYQVARARGSDAAYQGESGTLTITRSQSFNVPFYTSGHATITFS